MIYMFQDAKKFNQPLNNWNVSKVQSMKKMFASAQNFNQPLNSCDVSSVEKWKKCLKVHNRLIKHIRLA